jgi:hypothetical protein
MGLPTQDLKEPVLLIWMVGKMGGFGLFGVGFKGRLFRVS